MKTRNFQTVSITTTGANVPTGATSASVPLPVASSGQLAWFYRITTTANAHVRMGIGSATALATDAMVMPSDALIMERQSGVTHFAAIQDTAAGTVNIVPLEDA